MNKTIFFVGIIAGTIVAGIIASVELAEAAKPESLPAAVCPAENVQHWETIAWSSTMSFDHPTLSSVSGGIMKAQADPSVVYNYNELVTSALNNLGYLNSGSPITVSDVTFAVNQAEPQIICAES